MNKRPYIRPEINEVVIDNAISAQMYSPPPPPTPRDQRVIPATKGVDNTFKSPFGDKPFG